MSEQHHHITPVRTLALNLGALMVLMVLTVVAALVPPFLPNDAWQSVFNNTVALTIACLKATLVILIFMGVKYSTRLTQVYAVMGFLWVTLLGITFCDYLTRDWEPIPGWESPPTGKFTHGESPGDPRREVPRQYYGAP